jgi:sigma-B regulation protein RsbU (phosphoserine phosphatase)
LSIVDCRLKLETANWKLENRNSAIMSIGNQPSAISNRTTARLLIADDQPDVVEALHLLLKNAGYEVVSVNSPAAILQALAAQRFDLLLMDLNYTRDTTSGREGLDVLAGLQARDGDLPIVVMTAWSSVDVAVEAIHKGVGDFVQKPWNNEELLATVQTQIARGRARREAQRLEAETEQALEEAREIQQELLPTQIPQIPGYQLSGAWKPARLVGGDYFDVLDFGQGRVALCIADVVGKGMPAALLMSNLQAAIKAVATYSVRPQELCARLNRLMCGNTAPDKFITLFYALIDAPSGKLVYSNAGHNSPILLRRDGSCIRLPEGGVALGIFPEGRYEAGEVQLTRGDRLVLFTDGVTEAMSPQGEEFGEDRLLALATADPELGAAALQEKILQAVTDFSAGDLHDDATVIVLVVSG